MDTHHSDEAFYRKDVLFVRYDRSEGPLDDDRLVELTETERASKLGLNVDRGDQDRLGPLFDGDLTVQVIDRPTDQSPPDHDQSGLFDPLAIAIDLSRNNSRVVEASPILVMTIAGHWTYQPGAPPEDGVAGPSSLSADLVAPDFSPDAIVAVADTGYNASAEDWLSRRVAPVDAQFDADVRANTDLIAHGHGKFVASIVAQRAPATQIYVAALEPVGLASIFAHLPVQRTLELMSHGFVSDEVQLYVAVHRLIEKVETALDAGLEVDDDRIFLNLSLGGYECPGLTDSGLAVRKAVDLWTSKGWGPVFAAAGNREDHHSPLPPPPRFLPAAYAETDSRVIAVASVCTHNNLSRFSNDAAVKRLGEDLIGIRKDGEWAAWSGTSFATAVASGEAAADQVLPTGRSTHVAPVKHLTRPQQ